MTDRSEWYRIRKEMFEQVLAEVRERLGPEPRELKAYREDYEAELGRRWKVSDRAELFEALLKNPLVLLADFHALQQSQKTHLRLLKGLQELGGGPFVLALECLRPDHQVHIDRFMAGRISEKEFLKRVRWAEWGFPWENYQPLFDWARASAVPVVGLDRREAKMSVRDRQAAKRLARIRRDFPDRRVIAVYGDLHLAGSRLPAELAKAMPDEAPPVRVFQNAEQVSLRLLKKGLDHKIDVVRYDRQTFSIQNVPPWVKWQNYLLWLDQSADADLGEAGDITDPVAAWVRMLAREIGVDADPSGLTVYSADDPDLWSRIRKTAGASERPWIEMMIEDGRSFYLSKGGWGYLARPTVNHAAALAMQFVHDRLSGGAHLRFKMPDDFLKMIWIEAVAYFGSKIINPKRKSDTLADIRSSLASRRSDDRGREAMRLALSQKMSEMMAAGDRGWRGTELRPQAKSSWIAASHLLGALLGERLYHGYRRRLLSGATLRAMLAKPLGHQFPLIYQELLEIIESLPAPFHSKKEKL